MANSPSGRPSIRRSTWNKTAVERRPAGLCQSDRYRDCPWPRVLTPEEAECSGVDSENISALETIAEALFRSGLDEDKAVEAFDRAFGWAVDSAEAARAEAIMARVSSRGAA